MPSGLMASISIVSCKSTVIWWKSLVITFILPHFYSIINQKRSYLIISKMKAWAVFKSSLSLNQTASVTHKKAGLRSVYKWTPLVLLSFSYLFYLKRHSTINKWCFIYILYSKFCLAFLLWTSLLIIIYSLICPSPLITYFVVVNSLIPIGPRAWSFCVEIPISPPKPNSPPSENLVEAFK